MLLELKQITVPPGQTVIFNQITWQEFETLLDELGEHRSSRIAYANETLEIMTPLPEHEFSKELAREWFDIVSTDQIGVLFVATPQLRALVLVYERVAKNWNCKQNEEKDLE